MSIFQNVEKFFSKLFHNTTNAQKVLAAVGALAPFVEVGLAMEGDPQAGQAVAKVYTEVQTDLATVNSIVQKSGTSPTALSVLETIKTSLADVLTDSHVKNAATFSTIQTEVTAFISEIEAIIAQFPAQAPSAPPATA